jgi:transposase
MDATTVAVDLANDVFEVALANRTGRVLERKRLTRRQMERFIDTLGTGTEVVREACGTAHYWGRRCQARGLRVRLLPVQYVRPYVRRNKTDRPTDRTDTEALLEANRCGEIQPVPVKTVEQQTLQALHRVRTQWQAARTARINVMRGLLREHGLAIGVGARTRIPALVEDPAVPLPDLLRHTVALVLEEVRALDARVVEVDHQLARVAREHPIVQRLQQIPGVGVLTSTALVAAVNHIHAFQRGRQFASWLGLTPRNGPSARRPGAPLPFTTGPWHWPRGGGTTRPPPPSPTSSRAFGSCGPVKSTFSRFRTTPSLHDMRGGPPTRCSARHDVHGVTGRTGIELGR